MSYILLSFLFIITCPWSHYTRVKAQVPQCTVDPVCPSSERTEISSCSVTDDMGRRSTIWSGNDSVFGCPLSQLFLSHQTQPGVPLECLPASVILAPINGTSYTSILSVVPSSEMDGALIQCLFPTRNDLVQECVLNIVANPPSSPGCVPLTTTDIYDQAVNSSGISATSTNVTLRWSAPPSEGPITGYSIVITPPPLAIADYPSECRGSINPCNINISSGGSNNVTSDFNLSTSYTISVSAMNCDSQLGEPSLFGVNLKVPTGDIVKETIFLEYNNNQVLMNVFLSWRPVESAGGSITGCGETIIEVNDTKYIIVLSDISGTDIVLVNNLTCCNYSYSPSPSTVNITNNNDYNITLRAINDVGVGQGSLSVPINKFNNFFMVNVSLDLMKPERPVVNFTCQFFDSVIRNCTVKYGTDLNKLSLTAGPSEDVLELKDFLDYEEYYYMVYADRGDANITICGMFTTCVCLNRTNTACLELGYQRTCEPLPLYHEAPTGCTVSVRGRVAAYTCSGIYELVGESKRVYTVDNGWSQAPSSRVAIWFIIVIVIIVVLIAAIVTSTTAVIVWRFKGRKNGTGPSTHEEKSLELKRNPKQIRLDKQIKNQMTKGHIKNLQKIAN